MTGWQTRSKKVVFLPWYQSSLASQLSHVESIVIHLPEDCDDVPGLEAQLDLQGQSLMTSPLVKYRETILWISLCNVYYGS